MIFMNSLIILSHFNGDCLHDWWLRFGLWAERNMTNVNCQDDLSTGNDYVKAQERAELGWGLVSKTQRSKDERDAVFVGHDLHQKKLTRLTKQRNFGKRRSFRTCCFCELFFSFQDDLQLRRLCRNLFWSLGRYQCLAVASYTVELCHVRLKSSSWGKSMSISVFL